MVKRKLSSRDPKHQNGRGINVNKFKAGEKLVNTRLIVDIKIDGAKDVKSFKTTEFFLKFISEIQSKKDDGVSITIEKIHEYNWGDKELKELELILEKGILLVKYVN